MLIKKAFITQLLTIFFLFLAIEVGAEPVVNIQYKYYSIYPKTKWDLNKELNERSPINFQGKRYRGYTKWFVQWQYKWWKTDKDCKITTVKTILDVTYTLPKIPPNHPTNAEARQVFLRYFTALFKHEENHKNSGLYAARAIEKSLLGLGIFPNCPSLEAAAESKAQQIIQQYRQRDINYDKQTDNGRAEGIMIENFLKLLK
jgi:predicted secreted Zn-dependent protease